MPYGIDQALGGDSKENITWMEECIKKVSPTIQGANKQGHAIAICKATLRKHKGKKSEAAIDINNYILNLSNSK